MVVISMDIRNSLTEGRCKFYETAVHNGTIPPAAPLR
jgi:hypothetical protein